MTGKYSTNGTMARNGAILAMEEFNASGGIDGRPIVLLMKDDQGDSDNIEGIVSDLGDLGIRYIIGPLSTSSGAKLVPIINERKILTISGTVMGDSLEHKDDYFIKLNPSTRTYGMEIGRFLLNEGYTKPALIADINNNPYCKTLLAGYSGAFKGPAITLTTIECDGKYKIPYSEIADKTLEKGTDAVLICASALDTAFLAQHMKRISKDVFLMSAPWSISQELIRNGGDAVDGLHFYLSILYEDTSARTKSFEEKFQTRFRQKASFVSMFNYEAATMLVDALRTGPADDPDRIKEIILGKPIHRGVQKDFSLDRNGDPLRPLYLHKINKGRITQIQVH
jgi:branched-chain amino acid transport system substrate-binding protein